MREQPNVTFEPNLGPAFPVCSGAGTAGSAYGAAYGVSSAGQWPLVRHHQEHQGYGYGSGSGGAGPDDGRWVEAAQSAIGRVDARGRGCGRNMWPDRLGGVRFGACCPTEISFGRILPEYTRAAMQEQEEANQKQMLQDARSAQQSEVASGEFSEYGEVSSEQSRDPDIMPHLSADYGGYKDFGGFDSDSGYGSGSGTQNSQSNGGRCSWR